MQQFHKQAIYVILTFQAKMLSYLEQLFCRTSSSVGAWNAKVMGLIRRDSW